MVVCIRNEEGMNQSGNRYSKRKMTKDLAIFDAWQDAVKMLDCQDSAECDTSATVAGAAWPTRAEKGGYDGLLEV